MYEPFPAAFIDTVRQALKHLYDLAQLQRVAQQLGQSAGVGARRFNARQLQVELIDAVDQLRSTPRAEYLSSEARLFNLVHGHYVEGMSIEQVARENAVSVRQVHRDLRRGEEVISHTLWEKFGGEMGAQGRAEESLAGNQAVVEDEVSAMGGKRNPIEVVSAIRRASNAVESLTALQAVTLDLRFASDRILASANELVAQQLLVSLLSHVVQRALFGTGVRIVVDQQATRIQFDVYFVESELPGAEAFATIAAPLLRNLEWRVAVDGAGHIALVAPRFARHVLVIDDNEGLIDLMSHYLGEHGFEVIGCQQSTRAVEAASTLQPAFIVLDVMMPGQDGWHVLRALKADSLTRQLPVVICSVFEDRKLAESLNARSYLVKPVTRQSVTRIVEEMG